MTAPLHSRKFNLVVSLAIRRRVAAAVKLIHKGWPRSDALAHVLTNQVLAVYGSLRQEIVRRVDLAAEGLGRRHLVAVYGSLRHGLHNHGRLISAERVGDDEVRRYRMLDLGFFPGLVPELTAKFLTKVEVYRVDDATLDSLDSLEGHPRFYRRTTTLTEQKRVVFIYVLADPSRYTHCREVTGGDWKVYHEAKAARFDKHGGIE